MVKYEANPYLPQAQQWAKSSQSGELTFLLMDSIRVEEKREPVEATLTGSFPKDYTPRKQEDS